MPFIAVATISIDVRASLAHSEYDTLLDVINDVDWAEIARAAIAGLLIKRAYIPTINLDRVQFDDVTVT